LQTGIKAPFIRKATSINENFVLHIISCGQLKTEVRPYPRANSAWKKKVKELTIYKEK
jgi:hypothetical protein